MYFVQSTLVGYTVRAVFLEVSHMNSFFVVFCTRPFSPFIILSLSDCGFLFLYLPAEFMQKFEMDPRLL